MRRASGHHSAAALLLFLLLLSPPRPRFCLPARHPTPDKIFSTRTATEPRPRPPTTWALLAGADAEGDPLRRDVGDGGLRAALIASGLPERNAIFLSTPRACGRARARRRLAGLLRRTSDGDVLVFYYGGHGLDGEYCTPGGGGHWTHRDVVDIIEENFRGSVAWILSDCCYSGTVYRALRAREETGRPLRVSYGCVMSTGPDSLARGHWTFTEVLIRALDRRMTVEEALGFAADGMARVKRDRLTFYSCGTHELVRPDAPFLRHRSASAGDGGAPPPKPRRAGGAAVPLFRRLSLSPMPRRLSLSRRMAPPHQDDDDPLRRGINPPLSSWAGVRTKLAIGDAVFARWEGGTPKPASNLTSQDSSSQDVVPYFMPLWFPAVVASLQGSGGDVDDPDAPVEVEMSDPTTSHRWVAVIDRHHLLPGTYFDNHCDWSDDCVNAQVAMARRRIYVTYALPAGTRVRVLWHDGVQYGAEVLRQRGDADWERIVELGGRTGIDQYDCIAAGPFVWVRWDEDRDKVDLAPLSRCVLEKDGGIWSMSAPEIAEKAERDEAAVARDLKTPHQALLWSLRSASKFLCPAEWILPGEGRDPIEGFWDVEGYWYPIKPIGPSELRLEELASHVCYEHTGEYCPVLWLDDSTKSVVPKQLVRRRLPTGAEEDLKHNCFNFLRR